MVSLLPLLLACSVSAAPRVAVLSTGGTIDMSGAMARSAQGPAAVAAPELQGALEAQVPVFDPPLDSSVVEPRHWKKMIGVVQEQAAAPGIAAVLKHGTDTLDQTGLVLSMAFDGALKAPVVLTGAWTPADQPGSDAEANLRDSFAVAASPRTPPLVYAVIGGEIHLASRLKKVRTEPRDGQPYFVSAGGPVGRVVDGEARFDPAFLALAPSWKGLGVDPGRIGFARMRLVPEAKRPSSLDPLKAALKRSLIAGTLGRGAEKELLGRDLAGELVDGYRAPPLPAAARSPDLRVLFAFQDLDATAIAREARRLSSKRPGRARTARQRALEASHPVLAAIGAAVRSGVEVVMATRASLSPTDLSLYEVGRMLAGVGARDSGGKDLAALLAEKPSAPRLVIVGTGSGHLPIGEASFADRIVTRRP